MVGITRSKVIVCFTLAVFCFKNLAPCIYGWRAERKSTDSSTLGLSHGSMIGMVGGCLHLEAIQPQPSISPSTHATRLLLLRAASGLARPAGNTSILHQVQETRSVGELHQYLKPI